MRLFVAILFEEKNKEFLNDVTQKLRGQALLGNTTRQENLHLTLAFIGEVPDSACKKVCAVMDVIKSAPFSLTFSEFGKFSKDEEDLYWLGAQPCQELETLQKQLLEALLANQIPVDQKPFKPHITLGRRMVMEDGFSEEEFAAQIVPVTQKVKAISLMKSERINGKLTYTQVYQRKLKG